jgi:hypothetical protein
LAAVESQRNRFDSYFAIAVRQGKDDPWYAGRPEGFLWRKGERWRFEIGLFRGAPPKPEGEVDRVKWWKEQSRMLSPIEVCDGTTVYHANYEQAGQADWEAVRKVKPGRALEEAGGQVQSSMPEMFGYPSGIQNPAHVFTVDVIPHPGEGPADSILVKYLVATAVRQPGQFRDYRYWVDPGKGYVARQYEWSGARDADGSSTTVTHTIEELDRSPRGIWYPILVREKVVRDPPPADPNYVGETVTRFFVDFEAELPDDLFRPIAREPNK